MSLRRQELPPGRAGPSRSGIDTGCLEDLPDGGGVDLVAESDKLAVDAAVAQLGFSLAIRSTRARIAHGTAGRPGNRLGYVQRRPTRWACQRSRVLGDTSRSRRSPMGSSLLSAPRTARSTQVKVGRGLCRRSTATSCRSTRISTSLAASDRASSASQLRTRASVRYASRKAMVIDDPGGAAGSARGVAPQPWSEAVTQFSSPTRLLLSGTPSLGMPYFLLTQSGRSAMCHDEVLDMVPPACHSSWTSSAVSAAKCPALGSGNEGLCVSGAPGILQKGNSVIHQGGDDSG
jgi:hypothetical protein